MRMCIEFVMVSLLAKSCPAQLPIALISGRYSKATEIRAKEMKIEHCFQGSLDKLTPFYEICKFYNVDFDEVAYIGDGLIDIPVMEKVAIPITVPGAHQLVKEVAVYESEIKGGQGVLREVVEWILKGQNRHSSILEKMRKHTYKA